jgi:signal transduction histidine kinase
LTAIEESGRRAMVDLERVLVLLRDGRPPAQEQQPTLADADRLLAAARATGAPVVAHIEGPIDSLPAVVSREGYRILQEGLTNVFRHVGPVPITVRVLAGADRLNLSVSNPLPVGDGGGQPGRADPALDPPGTGSSLMRDPSGLRGVRERATLLRGDVTAGRVGADWLLHVRLPLGLPG